MNLQKEKSMDTSTTQSLMRAERSPRRRVALIVAAGFLVLATFQAALALGAPLGRAAWGGTYEHLPIGLRLASAIAVGIWIFAALLVLRRTGLHILPLPTTFARWGTWVLVGLLVLSALVNFASSSGWERFLWGPFAVIMTMLCFVVARGADTSRKPPVSDTSAKPS
jgi:hypothetical protein